MMTIKISLPLHEDNQIVSNLKSFFKLFADRTQLSTASLLITSAAKNSGDLEKRLVVSMQLSSAVHAQMMSLRQQFRLDLHFCEHTSNDGPIAQIP